MAVVLACLCIQSSCTIYSTKAITGKIVDAETGEPLSGVNVVAQWRIDRKMVGDEKSLLKIMETVSNKDGNYDFPAWGPVVLPPLANFGQGSDPLIYYFKHGYWPGNAQNDTVLDTSSRTPPLGEFKWNGKTIKLKKWDGQDVENYGIWIRGISHLTDDWIKNERKAYRSYPRMLNTLIEEASYFEKIGAKEEFFVCVPCFEAEKLEFLNRFKQK